MPGSYNVTIPDKLGVDKGYMKVQWPPSPYESQQQAAWRVLVIRVVFNDRSVDPCLSNLLLADIPLNDAIEGVAGQVERAIAQLSLDLLDRLQTRLHAPGPGSRLPIPVPSLFV